MGSVLITGGMGFTGRYIVRALHDRGQPVVNYTRDFVASGESDIVSEQGELFDIPRILRVFERHQVEAIVHTAAMSHPTLSLDFPIGTFSANVDGTLCLLEAARVAKIKRFVNFSSETVYGAVDGQVGDDTPVKPSTPYAVSKVTTEWLGDVYTKHYGLDVISLRIAQVYGPGNKMPEIVGDILKSLQRTGSYRFHQGRDHGFNFVHAADVASATLRTLDAKGPFGRFAYNVSSGEYWRVGDLVDLVRKCRPNGEIEIGPGRLSELDMKGPLDLTSTQRDLGFEPAWGLERGIVHYIEHLETHPW
ncbi:NAD-dependent epimerase/dehydratase family protein [Pendulispora albinea]|uniref:NAD-dependent epimerase/dehydratase family protein n=1 Tax=Pendulispora albinea TaxID=2741071 RepID=A0ABZ2MB41_9BACT